MSTVSTRTSSEESFASLWSSSIGDHDEYIHLEGISVDFIKRRPTSDLQLVFKDDAGVEYKSDKFKKGAVVHWNIDILVRTQTSATLTIQRAFPRRSFADILVKFDPIPFWGRQGYLSGDSSHRVTVEFLCGISRPLADVTHILGSRACTALASKVNMLDGLDKILGFLKLPQLASEAAQLNPIAFVTVSVVNQVIVNIQEIPAYHKQFVALIDDLVSMLPIIHSALGIVGVAECRALVRSFVEFVKEMSEQLNMYASKPTWTSIVENWYKSKRSEVGSLREKSTRLKQNINLAIVVDFKEQQFLANRGRILNCTQPPAGSSFDSDPKHCCALDTSLDLAPPAPPTSERPGYDVLYATFNGLNGDILLDIFDYYRLDDENGWNVRLGWRKLFHVCQRWRHLIFESTFHLGMHIQCTNGTPIADTLDHLPPLPLFINYRYTNIIGGQDELGMYHALRLRDRVRRIDLHLPPSILHKCLMLMGEPFPILEHLSLSFTVDKTTTLTLPKTFLAPNLRHLTLPDIGLPKRLRLLTSTVSLVTLVFMDVRTSGYFRPRLFVARLQSLPHLKELSIEFSIPIPRPSAERELSDNQGTPVTLPNLKFFRFKGVSAYLECLVAQIRTPLLERLDVTLFNQIAFALPHLSHFTNITGGLKSPAKVFFERGAVSITTTLRETPQPGGGFILRVMCRQLDWQIDCAAQICTALMPALSGIEMLTLDLHERMMPREWQNGEIDGTTWHELLRSFIGVKELHICNSLTEELSRALEGDEIVSDPGFLPSLQELIIEFDGVDRASLFGSFAHARQIAVSFLSPASQMAVLNQLFGSARSALSARSIKAEWNIEREEQSFVRQCLLGTYQ